jgi:DNA-binding PadR family transcriptional regulator
MPVLRRPFSPTVLHILLSLTEGPRHGYAIKLEIESRSGGVMRLGPGTLYETIQRLLDARLLRETSGESDPVNGQEAQRRYYELTPRGRQMLRQEIEQWRRLVNYANGRLEPA